jgi:hypothetical protein
MPGSLPPPAPRTSFLPSFFFSSVFYAYSHQALVDSAKKAGLLSAVFLAEDPFGRPVLLFRNTFIVTRLENDPDLNLGLVPWALPPLAA